jgi:hypothetical protein
MRAARTWVKAGLKPHQLRRYTASDDPDFTRKAADAIGFYPKPPANAVVFCEDEKTAIQALDRLARCCRFRQVSLCVMDLSISTTELFRYIMLQRTSQ